MKSSLFLKLLGAALALILVTLLAVDSTITHYAARAPSDPAVNELRQRILTISLSAAVFALVIAYSVSRSLSHRVTRLKQFAETVLDTGSPPQPEAEEGDELRALELSLNTMATRFRELVERLSVESARREAILSSMAEGVLAVDENLRVTFCNHSFARLMSLKGPVYQGVPLLEVARDPGLLGVLTRALGSGASIKQRLQILPAAGRYFEVQATPLATASGRGAIAVLHDTTDLERLEQVRKDFVANVSHELRTPLAAIVGYAETLLDGALDDPPNNRRFIQGIQSSAIRLNNIASDLLVLSELDAGFQPSGPVRISVEEALAAALAIVSPEAKARGVNLIRGTTEDAEVLGAKIRLEQALVNLLTNAIKFNRTGGDVRTDVGRTPEGQVFIRIADTGAGIPFEDLPRIFERFYRVDKARSRQVGGTGLGLSIVKHIVERMDGRIAVESQLGKGSVFTVLLPAPQVN